MGSDKIEAIGRRKAEKSQPNWTNYCNQDTVSANQILKKKSIYALSKAEISQVLHGTPPSSSFSGTAM